MKKLSLLLAIIMILSIPMTAHGATPRILSIMPELSFDGTTANISVAVVGDTMDDEIDVTVKLWYGSSCIQTWTDSDKGYVFIDGTAIVTKGRTYKLTVDVTYNGVTKPQVYVEGKCE